MITSESLSALTQDQRNDLYSLILPFPASKESGAILREVVSKFADLCGARGLDPVEVLALLAAQDWHPADEDHISAAGLTVQDDPIIPSPVMEVDPSLWTDEERAAS